MINTPGGGGYGKPAWLKIFKKWMITDFYN